MLFVNLNFVRCRHIVYFFIFKNLDGKQIESGDGLLFVWLNSVFCNRILRFPYFEEFN